jgi:DNA-binding NtrC family response regulator
VADFPQFAAHVVGFDVRIPPIVSAPLPVEAPRQEIVHVAVSDPNAMTLLDGSGDVRKLDEIEGETIKFAINHYRGQMSKVARKLGIGRSTLYRKLKDLGMAEDDILEVTGATNSAAWLSDGPDHAA